MLPQLLRVHQRRVLLKGPLRNGAGLLLSRPTLFCSSSSSSTSSSLTSYCRPRQRLFSSAATAAGGGERTNLVYREEVITPDEEAALITHLEPILRRRRYEKGHWDSVIIKYKELELVQQELPADIANTLISLTEQVVAEYDEHKQGLARNMLPPHVIDLEADGHIAPHIDNIRHSGAVLAGLSLLSTRILRLHKEDDAISGTTAPPTKECIELALRPRSLYVLKGPLRFDYAHSILGPSDSPFHVASPPLHRRLSIIFRDAAPSQGKNEDNQ